MPSISVTRGSSQPNARSPRSARAPARGAARSGCRRRWWPGPTWRRCRRRARGRAAPPGRPSRPRPGCRRCEDSQPSPCGRRIGLLGVRRERAERELGVRDGVLCHVSSFARGGVQTGQRRTRVKPPGATVTGTSEAGLVGAASRRPLPSYDQTSRGPVPGTVDGACARSTRGRAAQQRGAVTVAAEHEPATRAAAPSPRRAGPRRRRRAVVARSARGRRPGSVRASVTGSSAPGAGRVALRADVAGPHRAERPATGGERGDRRAAGLQVDDREHQRAPGAARGRRSRVLPAGHGDVAGAAVLRLAGPQRRRASRRARRRRACASSACDGRASRRAR